MSNNRFPCRLFSFCLISIALLVSFKCAYCIRWLFESALSAVIWTHGHVPRFSFLSRRIQRWSAWYVNSFQWWCLRNMLSNFFFFSLLLPSPFIFTFAYLRPSRFFVFFLVLVFCSSTRIQEVMYRNVFSVDDFDAAPNRNQAGWNRFDFHLNYQLILKVRQVFME